MSRRMRLALIVALAVALGSLREFLFVNLNYQIDHVQRHTAYSYAHSAFQSWTAGMRGASLVRLKWSAGFLFTASMLTLTILFSRAVTGSHRRARTIIGLFVVTAALAFALHGLAHWWPPLGTVGVKLLHLLQFPVLLFFVWAAEVIGRGAPDR